MKSFLGALHSKTVLSRRARVLADMIQHLLPARASILDVGSGDGLIASMWRRSDLDVSVIGIDVFVRDETYIPVRVFDGYIIPYADKSVDVITFVDVLHHASDAQILLHEAARVARHSVIVKDHLAENSLDHIMLRLMDWVGNASHGVTLPCNYFSYVEWMEQFNQAGLMVVSFDKEIPIYSAPFHVVFGRGLHFLAQLAAGVGSAAGPSQSSSARDL